MGVRSYLEKNWGTLFIAGCLLLLIVSAIEFRMGLDNAANATVALSFISLIFGVVLQIASFLRFDEFLSRGSEIAGPVKRVLSIKKVLIIMLVVLLIAIPFLLYMGLNYPIVVRHGSGDILVPGDAGTVSIYDLLASSLGLPGGTTPGTIFESNQLASVFSNATASSNGTLIITLLYFTTQVPSIGVSISVSSATIQAAIIPMSNDQSNITLTAEMRGVTVSAHGNRASFSSAKVSADVVADQRIVNISGRALYQLISNLRPSDASWSTNGSFTDLSFCNSDNSSTFSANSLTSRFTLTNMLGTSSVNSSLQLAGVNAKTSLYSGRLSSLHITGSVTIDESSGTLSYSYGASTTLSSLIRGFIGL